LSNNKSPEREGKVQLIDATSMFASMRKSLGSKRRYLTDEQIAEIARLHDAFEENERSKIFATTDFGYRRITVERPLRLAFTPHDEAGLAALQEEKVWQRLEAGERASILAALAQFDERIPSRATFTKNLQAALKPSGVKVGAPVMRLLTKHLSVSDENAELCKSRGQVEPDPSLRDYENVPLGEDVREYFEREVLPHVPDAWIDETKRDEKDGEVGIVGYEIPFNRHFYTYTPP